MTIQEINQQIAELQANISRQSFYEREKNRLTEELRSTKSEELNLVLELRKEQKDVDALQSLTLKSLLARMKGTRDYQLHQEEYELVEAKAKLDRFKLQQQQLLDELKELDQKLLEIEDQKAQISDLLQTKRQLISEQPDEVGRKLNELMDSYYLLKKQEKEVNEAIAAGKACNNTLYSALESLESAKNWGTYDLISRGGLISHAVKYNRIDTAQARLSKAQIQIRKFQKELKDVDLKVTTAFLDISDTQRTIDFWFDNIFTDFNVLGKINDTILYTQQNKTKIQRTLSTLRSTLNGLQDQIKKINNQMNEITLSYNEKSSLS
jgi:chromosome segregation ATPase